jgi:hypothetical protein
LQGSTTTLDTDDGEKETILLDQPQDHENNKKGFLYTKPDIKPKYWDYDANKESNNLM